MSERTKTRRYVVQGTVAVGVLGLAVLGVAQSLPAQAGFKSADAKQARTSTAHAPAEDKVEAALYSRVMRLRQDIALTNQDLAALGLTEAQAGDVLTRLVAWVETHQPAMIAADNRAQDARRELALLQRRIRTGEADAREVGGLSDLHRSVAEADGACEVLRVQAGEHAVAPAPEAVQGQWDQARANKHLPVALRHVAGLDTQRLRALMADAVRAEQRNPEGVSSGGAIEAGLTFSEQESRDTARQNIQTNLPGVAAAEAEVLPVPASLWDDEAMLTAMDRESQEQAE